MDNRGEAAASVPPQASNPIESIESEEARFAKDCNAILTVYKFIYRTTYFAFLLPEWLKFVTAISLKCDLGPMFTGSADHAPNLSGR